MSDGVASPLRSKMDSLPMSQPAPHDPCPCQSGHAFAACCGPLLDRQQEPRSRPASAEALMRSRYTAFAIGDVDYLLETLIPETQDDFDRTEVEEWSQRSRWTGLEVVSAEPGKHADEALVEFIARFQMDGRDLLHHETGRFLRRDGRWLYADGIMGQRPRSAAKIGRNDPCPCGSGKKHKKCCGA
jgi:SEC-C motif domain protein